MSITPDADRCTCGHARLFHGLGVCDMCACRNYQRPATRCYACGRDLDNQPWPLDGYPCGHCDDYSHGLAEVP